MILEDFAAPGLETRRGRRGRVVRVAPKDREAAVPVISFGDADNVRLTFAVGERADRREHARDRAAHLWSRRVVTPTLRSSRVESSTPRTGRIDAAY